jgi:hypothetical protein
MKIVNLVGRDRRSFENSQSSVCEDSLDRLAGRPVLAHHVAEIARSCTPSQTIALIICAHAMEARAARQLSFEVINAGKLDIRAGRWSRSAPEPSA